MAYSSIIYSGNGSQTTFAVPFPFLDRSHVSVLVAGASVGLTWDSDSQVRLVSPAAAGTNNVKLVRTTPRIALTSFSDGATLTAANLNRADLQNLYINQEEDDSLLDTLRFTSETLPGVSRILPSPVANTNLSWDSSATSLINSAPGSVALSVPASQSVDQTKLAADAQYRVNTIAALKALGTTYTSVLVLGYYAAGDGGGGVYRWNSGDVTTENGGSVIKVTSITTGRYNLVNTTGVNNPKQFGAYGNGVNNDSLAFQAALSTPGDVYVPQGVYLVDRLVSTYANRMISLSPGALLKLKDNAQIDASGSWLLKIQGFQSTLSGGIFEGNSANQINLSTIVSISAITKANPGVFTTATPHSFTTGIHIRISGCLGMVEANGYYGVVEVLSATTFRLGNVSEYLNTSAFGTYTGSGTVGQTWGFGNSIVYVEAARCTVQGCVISDSAAYGIFFQNAFIIGGTDVYEGIVSNCRFLSNKIQCILGWPAVNRMRVQDCDVIDCPSFASVYVDKTLSHTSNEAIFTGNRYWGYFQDKQIGYPQQTCIELSGNYHIGRFVISNNIILGNRYPGAKALFGLSLGSDNFEAGGDPQGLCEIVGNTFAFNMRYGIEFGNGLKATTIANNTFYDCVEGLILNNTASGVNISDNVFRKCTSSCVTMYGAHGSATITDNVFLSCNSAYVVINIAGYTITGITQAASAVITVSGEHYIPAGSSVYISGVGGMTAINGQTAVVTAATLTTMTIAINSSGYGAFTSGGNVAHAGDSITSPIRIVNNEFRQVDYGSTSPIINATAQGPKVFFKGNLLTFESLGYGLPLIVSGSGWVVSDNEFLANSWSGTAITIPASISKCIVKDNIIRGYANGITSSASAGKNVIKDNIFDAIGTATTTTAGTDLVSGSVTVPP